MELFVGALRRLKDIADAHAASFRSEGFTRFFSMLATELDDDYFAEMQTHLQRAGVPAGHADQRKAGPGQQGAGYVLRQPPSRAGATASQERAGPATASSSRPKTRTGSGPWPTSKAWDSTTRRMRWRNPLTTSGASSRCYVPSWASTSAA